MKMDKAYLQNLIDTLTDKDNLRILWWSSTCV